MRRLIYTIIMLMSCLSVWADTNTERYQAFIHNTRCMVCENQSVAESNSMFAQDMKEWIKEAIESGQTDAEIKMALVERFGDSVFYEPPFQANTWLLWGLPGVFVLLGVAVVMVVCVNQARTRGAS